MRMTATLIALSLALPAVPALAQQGGGPGPGRPAGMLVRADADRDGAVSRAEIERFRAERFAEADADGDAVVTRAELVARAEARAAARAGAFFDRMDRDGDGRVSRAEFDAQGAARLDRLFARADGNRDGLLTRREMRRGWRAPAAE